MEKKLLFKKPVGPSGVRWNNEGWGTDGPILCEICGRTHPEDKEQGYIVSKLFGLQVVEECCGGILDIIYRESAEVFALRLLEEFAENPADGRFYIFFECIKDAMKKATEKLAEVSGKVAEIPEAAQAL